MIKLFTHTDLDGVSCGIVLKALEHVYECDKSCDIEYCDYDDVNEKIQSFINDKSYEKYDNIYITDISINKETAELIDETVSEKIILLDHHTTALWLNQYKWANVTEKIINEPTCGSHLLFLHLCNQRRILNTSIVNTLLNFVNDVREYDTWLWHTKYKHDRLIPKLWNDLFLILGRESFIEKALNKIKNNALVLTDSDYKLLHIEHRRIQRYIDEKSKELIVKKIMDYNVGIVFAEQYVSELGNTLSENNPDLDFIMIINPSKSVSYRTSRNDIHLGNDVASLFGGGGHAQSAGSPIGDDTKIKILELILEQGV